MGKIRRFRKFIMIALGAAVVVAGFGQACSNLVKSNLKARSAMASGNGGGYGGMQGIPFGQLLNGAFSVSELPKADLPTGCYNASTQAEFDSDLQQLMTTGLTVGGQSYSCVIDGSTPNACYSATSWDQFDTLLTQLMSDGSVSISGSTYVCVDSDGLPPLPCYEAPATMPYSDYIGLVEQVTVKGRIVIDGQTYTCVDGRNVQPQQCYVCPSTMTNAEYQALVIQMMTNGGNITIDGTNYTCLDGSQVPPP